MANKIGDTINTNFRSRLTKAKPITVAETNITTKNTDNTSNFTDLSLKFVVLNVILKYIQ